MKLLVDTDIFCKLAIAGILADAMRAFGSEIGECARLAALPYMLSRGRLRTCYTPAVCDELVVIARTMRPLKDPGGELLDVFTRNGDIDPGEAQLFAAAVGHDVLVLTGDKRAVRAVAKIGQVGGSLGGRIVAFEAVLLALVNVLGVDVVRERVQVIRDYDHVVRVCMSPENANPVEALTSYYRHLAAEVHPLELWSPF